MADETKALDSDGFRETCVQDSDRTIRSAGEKEEKKEEERGGEEEGESPFVSTINIAGMRAEKRAIKRNEVARRRSDGYVKS